MKIKFFLLVLFIVFNHPVFAQLMKKKDVDFMQGLELVIPNSNFRNSFHTGYGLSSKLEYMIGKHSSLTGGIGLYYLPAKEGSSGKVKDMLPLSVKAGGRYFLGNYYCIAEAGVLLFTQQSNNSSFLYAAGVGDKLSISDRIFDVNLRYEAWPAIGRRTSAISLGFAYQFAIH